MGRISRSWRYAIANPETKSERLFAPRLVVSATDDLHRTE